MTMTTIKARNTASDSPNPIHTEEARQHGFRGGIVPGLTLYAYLVRPLVDIWGPTWLQNGQMETQFRAPVYDGDEIVVSAERISGPDSAFRISVRNENGDECVRGTALQARDRPAVEVAAYPSVPAVDAPLDEGTPERLAADGTLWDFPVETGVEYVQDYLTQIGEVNPVYDDVLHPAVIARVSAYIVGRQFEFHGPRIHTSLRTRSLATAPVDAELTARGRIVKVWERNGSHYLRSDLLVVNAAGDPIMQIDSESIFRLGARS